MKTDTPSSARRRIISWNLNHRTIEKPVPEDAVRFLIESGADLISLNEFVDGPSRIAFKDALTNAGFIHQFLSPSLGKNNQVFIASRMRIVAGDITPPTLTEAAITNFLHVKIDDSDIELVGFRAPAYKLGSERHAYWKQMTDIIRANGHKNIVFVGDINYDPFINAKIETSAIYFEPDSQFTIPNPAGAWSFISANGKNTSRIDHAIVATGVAVSDVEYVATFNEIRLAGATAARAITDHAVLAFSIDIGASLSGRHPAIGTA